MSSASINTFEVEYARFNAQKTLSTTTPSAFEHTRFGDLHVTRDRARSDGYYNRILGLASQSVDQLDSAIDWIEHGTTDADTRVDVSDANTEISNRLTERGFSHVDTLVWMQLPADAPPSIGNAAIETQTVRELTTQDWPSIRQNRGQEWPIEDHIWRQKRHLLCTTTFRWFGIFDGGKLISTASTWTISGSAAVTILGSAFTLPGYRNNGRQRQLLESRKLLVGGSMFVDVAPDSSSHRNCVRAGFTDLDRRQVWTKQASTQA